MTPSPFVVSPGAASSGVVSSGVATPAGESDDPLTECPTVGPGTGFHCLSQSLLECGPGRSRPQAAAGAEQVLFVLSGRGSLHLGGQSHPLEPESGALLLPDEEYELENPGPEPLRLVRVQVPEPERRADAAGPRTVVRRLADQEAEAATTEREFRIVADPASGLSAATHFVGYIPTARAPEHFHTYDEVIYVLDGRGDVPRRRAPRATRARIVHPASRPRRALP